MLKMEIPFYLLTLSRSTPLRYHDRKTWTIPTRISCFSQHLPYFSKLQPITFSISILFHIYRCDSVAVEFVVVVEASANKNCRSDRMDYSFEHTQQHSSVDVADIHFL